MRTGIVTATKRLAAPHFRMMWTSVDHYATPQGVLFMPELTDQTFGEAYNRLHSRAICNGWDLVIHANDDVVLRPDTIAKLLEDVEYLEANEINWGWLAARTDWVRHSPQNIRYPYDNKALGSIGYPEESLMVEVPTVSPIFAITKASTFLDYAPINWMSDDEQCYRMRKAGYRHFVSRAYVHHVGSQTMVPETWAAEQAKAFEVLRTFNPEFLQAYGIE